eukprot:GHVL01019890.1.p1 GENE.GHVL01019890.1~~GHVL01019890.1.p1  ORF type:complete len:855 (+),score=181.88 GHVL01019890.1:170-2734(+)
MYGVARSFSLLLLEEGEVYICDYEITLTNITLKTPPCGLRGRFRICSKSLFFEPISVEEPITKFPLLKISDIYSNDKFSFTFKSNQIFLLTTSSSSKRKARCTKSYCGDSALYQWLVKPIRVCSDQSVVDFVSQLWTAVRSDTSKRLVNQKIIKESEHVTFDITQIGIREKLLFDNHLWTFRSQQLVKQRGMLQISDKYLYFQPYPNFSTKTVKKVSLSWIVHIFRRTFRVQPLSLEIIYVNQDNHPRGVFLTFETSEHREQVLLVLEMQIPKCFHIQNNPTEFLSMMTRIWQNGKLSNYHYLDFLNCLAGRSLSDFSHYPVFPWVLTDFQKKKIQLTDRSIYRDLSKPLGVLNPHRLELLKNRMNEMTDHRFLFGSHYSTPGYVVYWLIRKYPESMLRLHRGKFDVWRRMFHSIQGAWEAVSQGHSNFMELIPEFYTIKTDFLLNVLGVTADEGPLSDVQLPPWAEGNPEKFLLTMREALESDIVSQDLPDWIDLIFGYKQSGEAAELSNNLFHPVTYLTTRLYSSSINKEYPNSLSIDHIPSEDDVSTLMQVQEFGQIPLQLFLQRHPKRLAFPALKSLSDPKFSEPWFMHLINHPDMFTRRPSDGLISVGSPVSLITLPVQPLRLDSRRSEGSPPLGAISKNPLLDILSFGVVTDKKSDENSDPNTIDSQLNETAEKTVIDSSISKKTDETVENLSDENITTVKPSIKNETVDSWYNIDKLDWHSTKIIKNMNIGNDISSIDNDNNYIFTTTMDGSLRVTSIKDNSSSRIFTVNNGLSSVCSTDNSDTVIVGGCNGSICLFNTLRGKLAHCQDCHVDAVTSLAWGGGLKFLFPGRPIKQLEYGMFAQVASH